MHPQQRHARFNLIVALSAAIPSVVVYAIVFTLYGPNVAWGAFGFLGICGLWGYGGHFYRKKKDSPAVIMDERDEDIKRRSIMIGWGADWLFWGLLCMGPWFVVVFRDGLEQTLQPVIPVLWLPLAYMATALVHVSASSIAILVLYGKGVGDDDV